MFKVIKLAGSLVSLAVMLMKYLERKHIEDKMKLEIIRNERIKLSEQLQVKSEVNDFIDNKYDNGELFDTDEFERK